MPVILCHWVLNPHFTIHLNGLAPSFLVNLFYKKFWVLSSILEKNQDETKRLGLTLWKLKKPVVELSQSSASHEVAPLFLVFVSSSSVVPWSVVVVCCCGWRWKFFYLSSVQKYCWKQGSVLQREWDHLHVWHGAGNSETTAGNHNLELGC